MSETPPLEPFTVLTAAAVPIDIANCDTDQLLPARFLRIATNDPRYASFLLHDLRFRNDGSSTSFVFDQSEFSGAQIVVGDINFGCGSSREMAVNGLTANKIRAVIAPSFGDIFYNNCIKNGVLPVRLPDTTCDRLREQLHASPGVQVTIDLAGQNIAGPDGSSYSFDIDSFDKHRLLNGLDDVGLTKQYETEITQFKTNYEQTHQWVVSRPL